MFWGVSGDISQFVRAKPRVKLPIIMTRDEVSLTLNNLEGVQWLVTALLYGAGLRIMEAIRLRVQDIDFGFNQIIVRDASRFHHFRNGKCSCGDYW